MPATDCAPAMATRSRLSLSAHRLSHLSETIEDALSVARRKTESPVVFRVAAQEAHRAGIAFYREGKVFLVLHIPASFLSLEPLPASSVSPSAPDLGV